MRRTNDHGWVAKAYNVSEPMGVSHSQPELSLFDDNSDVDSLDSFFDDDFDVQTSEEKLGNLLSCNTLGVEAKVITLLSMQNLVDPYIWDTLHVYYHILQYLTSFGHNFSSTLIL